MKCGENFWKLVRCENEWVVYKNKKSYSTGETPEEALVNFWIKINKK